MFFENHARLETDNFSRADIDCLACLGVAAFPGALLPNDEVPEAGKLYVFSLLQFLLN